MNPRFRQLLLLVILALAGFLRFYRIGVAPPGLHEDEATDGNDAWEAWRSGRFRVFYAENHGREGLLINLQAICFGVTGSHSPGALRWPGALLGTLTVLGVYGLAQQVAGKQVGLLAAFLMATNFWHINISRFGTRPVAAPFFLVWSLALLWFAARQLRGGARYWWVVAIFCGMVYGLGFYTYTPYRLTLLLLPCRRRPAGDEPSAEPIAAAAVYRRSSNSRMVRVLCSTLTRAVSMTTCSRSHGA